MRDQARATYQVSQRRKRPTPSTATKLSFVLAIVLASAISCARAAVAALANFSQSNQAIAPGPTDLRRLAAYFTPPYPPGPLPPQVSEILLRSAPAELRTACAVVVDSWGPAARGSARVTLRMLAVVSGNAWVAYRCDSADSRFASDYGERLAAFNAARGTIQFLDLAAPEDTRATLYHVGLANTFKLLGAEDSAAFEVFAVDSNPSKPNTAGAAPARASENRFVIVANSGSATRVALMLVTARMRPGAINRDISLGDSSEYRAKPRFDHDLAGHVTFVSVYHRDSSIGTRPHFGVTRYAWNPASLAFSAVKPEPLAPVKPHRLPPVPGSPQLDN